jgi:hypothetical protein
VAMEILALRSRSGVERVMMLKGSPRLRTSVYLRLGF